MGGPTMIPMKWLLTLAALIPLGGCWLAYPHYSYVEDMPHQWQVEPKYPLNHEHVVSRAMLYEELTDYSEQMQADGWRIEGPYPAGEFSPGKYYVVLSRPK